MHFQGLKEKERHVRAGRQHNPNDYRAKRGSKQLFTKWKIEPGMISGMSFPASFYYMSCCTLEKALLMCMQ